MKTDIRLIALDLDGTLLDSQKRLSARNEKVLRECIARGIYVVPVLDVSGAECRNFCALCQEFNMPLRRMGLSWKM